MKKIYYLLLLTGASLWSCSETRPEYEKVSKPDTLILSLPQDKDNPDFSETNPVYTEDGEEDVVRLILSKKDEQFLSLIDSISLGSTYNDVKKRYSELGMQRPEGNMAENARRGLTEAHLKTSLLDRQGNIEFNFKNDSLYSFYFTITEPDFEKGDIIYAGLQNYYSEKIGSCIEETAEEYNRYSKSCFWENNKYDAAMTYNLNSNSISWGIQEKTK
ncbi:MAG: hypothetical protein ACK4ND_19175 [Cytophagaceae bacterium]